MSKRNFRLLALKTKKQTEKHVEILIKAVSHEIMKIYCIFTLIVGNKSELGVFFSCHQSYSPTDLPSKGRFTCYQSLVIIQQTMTHTSSDFSGNLNET